MTPSIVVAVKWLLDPLGDLARGGPRRAGPGTTTTAGTAAAGPTGDEVVDLLLGGRRVELGQRRGGVGAVEPADRHDRVAGGQLVPGRRVRVHRGGHPRVVAGVGLEGLHQRGCPGCCWTGTRRRRPRPRPTRPRPCRLPPGPRGPPEAARREATRPADAGRRRRRVRRAVCRTEPGGNAPPPPSAAPTASRHRGRPRRRRRARRARRRARARGRAGRGDGAGVGGGRGVEGVGGRAGQARRRHRPRRVPARPCRAAGARPRGARRPQARRRARRSRSHGIHCGARSSRT